MRWLALVVAVACGEPDLEPPPLIAPPPVVPPKHPGPRKLISRWTKVVKNPSSCWFFSGPQDGRDDKLEGDVILRRHGNDIELVLGTATFTGTVDGGAVALSRASLHDSAGSWRVVETIHGTHVDGVFEGSYRYQECGPGDPCPNDQCTMTADLRIEP